MNNKYVVVILSHGRPNKVVTYDTLRKQGYTGRIVIVLDNEDKTYDQYNKKFENVVVFDKNEAAKITDVGDNQGHNRGVVFARNKIFDVVRDMGYEFFIVLDDDYTSFRHNLNDKGEFITNVPVKNLDGIFDAMVELFKNTPAKSIAMIQTGDLIGGGANPLCYKSRRKVMNSFICSTERPFKFFGRINEDVNAYINLGSRGDIFFQVPHVVLGQIQTQANAGGLTELYLDAGTYVKSFYSVMYQPSSIKVSLMGDKHQRLHHKITWKNAVPQIISQQWKKESI